jgi:hypothetical protein
MSRWIQRTLLLTALTALAACSTPPDTINTAEAAMIEEGNRFNTVKDGVLKQLYTGQAGPIPLERLPALAQAIDRARIEATESSKHPIPDLQQTFVLEASQVVELRDIITSESSDLKGLLVLASPTTDDRFDWVMMTVINLETWEPLDVRFNDAFGKTTRTLKVELGTFTTLNDYMQMIATASNSSQYAPKFALKRVFVPERGERVHLDQGLTAFNAYLPSPDLEKRFVVDASRAVYQVTPPSISTQSNSSGLVLRKVGALQ